MTDATKAFIGQLQSIDRKGLTVRDAVLLWWIVEHPGWNGQDIAHAVGIKNRSSVQSCFPRMIRRGLIEDRRPTERQAVPAVYHATPAGLEFWREIAPKS